MIRVLLADNHQWIHLGIQKILTQSDKLGLIEATVSGDQLRQLCREHQPDVVLLALNIADSLGADVFSRLQRHCPAANVLVLLDSHDDVCLRQLMDRGASGVILKSEPPEKLMEAILSVAHGKTWLSSALLPELMQPLTEEPAFALTEREIDVLRLLVAEKTGAEIAQALHMGERTVRAHLTSIYTKLGVKSQVGASREAVKRKLIQDM